MTSQVSPLSKVTSSLASPTSQAWVNQLSFLGGIRRRRPEARRLCAPVLQSTQGRLEGTGHPLLGTVQDAGGLARPESENVPQDQHGPLPGRQQLQGRGEGYRDRFGSFIPCLGLRPAPASPPAGRRGRTPARPPRRAGWARAAQLRAVASSSAVACSLSAERSGSGWWRFGTPTPRTRCTPG
jgi:hypothetical protein